MQIVKKLIFAVPFILATIAFMMQADNFLKDFSSLFSIDLSLLLKLVYFAVSIAAVSYLFVVFANFAADWKIVLPVIALSSLSSFLFSEPPLTYFLAIGSAIAFCISSFLVFNKIQKDPTNFQISNDVIKPSGTLVTLIILVISVALYFSATTSSKQLVQKFIDSIVNFSSNIINSQQLGQTTGATQEINSLISPDQINSLKQNPQALQQLGINPSVLNLLGNGNKTTSTSQNAAAEAIKPVVTQQITSVIQPFMPIIPALIAFYFYLNFQFITWLLSLILSPLVYLLFRILEKTGFIKFEITTREVKKLVV